MIWLLFLMAQAAAPSQVERGEALFTNAEIGCASCHAMRGKGTAAGPDLKALAVLTPKALAMAVRSTVTQYVLNTKLKTGESFPGYAVTGADKSITVWDVSKNPPVAYKVAQGEFTTTPNNSWKHPPGVNKLTNEQMADVVAFIRFAGANSRTAVSPDDVK